MQSRLINYINKNHLFDHSKNLIVGVSGGADSMVLLHLLKNLGFNISAAHCNFNLRPIDCDNDQLLVTNYCALFDIPVYTASFDTTAFAKLNKISTEMAARQLRYEWFEELRQQIKADYIAIAHHNNDSVETVFLNMTRGCGLRGITGIKPENNLIVRPLLFASRKDIEEFANENNIPYCTDKTNFDVNILRNRIRQNIFPEFEKMNTRFLETMSRNISIWNDWFNFSIEITNELIKTSVEKVENGFVFRLKETSSLLVQKLVFIEFLIQLGYNGNQAKNVAKLLNSICGTQKKTKHHTFTREREDIQIIAHKNNDECRYINDESRTIIITSLPFTHDGRVKLQITVQPYQSDIPITDDKNRVWVDADKIAFPLVWRTWKHGDRFIPFGMSNFKKVSDFLTNSKVAAAKKSEQTVIEDIKGIIWVVGHRIDNRYAVDKFTKNVVKCEFIEK